ncbi:AEC family transporter [Paenibacillus abyssi]|uniref:Transporter n=1 Tax=Paenibacillus abyssi TaxID=1340531 RepID=A0A917CN69_9BACL|nr:AEC family transporter [Paenibacillus abyssi]GGF93272.1 transporter [Paenibacillus abyssi]
MPVILLIVVNVIVPVFILIGAGVLLHRKYHFDLNTLSKISTNFLMPAVGFVNIYQSNIEGRVLSGMIGFLVLQNVALMLISAAAARSLKLERGLAATFKNSIVLNNSGNFGLPVSQLVFHNNPLGLSIQVMATIFQTFVTATYGLLNSVLVKSTNQGAKILLELLKLPIIYALLLGIILQTLNVAIPTFLWKPIENVSHAFIAIALLTLGAQIAYLKITRPSLPLIVGTIGRLVVSPIVAFLIITMLQLEGTTAQALFIASSYPASRNTALFALEYNNHPDYAAQAVLITTILSCITVTSIVYISKILF